MFTLQRLADEMLSPNEPFYVFGNRPALRPFGFMNAVPPAPPVAEFEPSFAVRETAKAWLIQADVPGVQDKDIEIHVDGRTLTVKGERRDEWEAEPQHAHRYGSFVQTFKLPEEADIEHVEAELKSGVLTLSVPKTEKAQPRRVFLKSTPSGDATWMAGKPEPERKES